MNNKFSRYLYILFLILGFFQCFWAKDYLQAATSFAIGIAFDPFDQTVKWADRPTWQKSVLVVQLGAVIFLFGFGFWKAS
jgi:hypothetical protein